jgi:hypothetical protein
MEPVEDGGPGAGEAVRRIIGGETSTIPAVSR